MMTETKTVLYHHPLPWSTAKPVITKITMPVAPWEKDDATADKEMLKVRRDKGER